MFNVTERIHGNIGLAGHQAIAMEKGTRNGALFLCPDPDRGSVRSFDAEEMGVAIARFFVD